MGSEVSPAGAGLSRSFAEVVLVKARVLPSGDQMGLPAPRGSFVTWRASPPLIDSTNTWPGCGRPPSSGDRTNASALPSGAQRGDASRGPVVSLRGSLPPAAGT